MMIATGLAGPRRSKIWVHGTAIFTVEDTVTLIREATGHRRYVPAEI